jgi:hypothetical protein
MEYGPAFRRRTLQRMTGPNHSWAGDVTYVATAEGLASLAVVLDLQARRVVGWASSDTNDTALALAPLTRAVRARRVVSASGGPLPASTAACFCGSRGAALVRSRSFASCAADRSPTRRGRTDSALKPGVNDRRPLRLARGSFCFATGHSWRLVALSVEFTEAGEEQDGLTRTRRRSR